MRNSHHKNLDCLTAKALIVNRDLIDSNNKNELDIINERKRLLKKMHYSYIT
jgi:hypothetical protein